MTKTFNILVALLLLAGCARVQSTVTVFHNLPQKGDMQTITIVPGDQSKKDSLEFRTYSEKLGHYLQAAGYKVIDGSPANPPRYIAVFGYGIDDGTLVSRAYAIPQFGVTGYSGSTTNGTISTFGSASSFNATTTNTPQYGVTGYATGTTTDRLFKRAIILDIIDLMNVTNGDKESGKTAQVYNAKLISEGSCGSMAGVMDPLLASLFKDFPGESGKARTVTVPFDSKC